MCTLLVKEVYHVPKAQLSGYRNGLVGQGLDSLQGLKCATVKHLTGWGSFRGHALQVHASWDLVPGPAAAAALAVTIRTVASDP